MAGIFQLLTPADLLAKLDRELARLRSEPDNVDHAFNFFVTAESMLDWLHPGMAAKAAREALRNSDVRLQIASHLATGAKHFDKLARHHTSVSSMDKRGGWFASGWFPKGWFGRGYFAEPTLIVHLDGAAAATFGSSATALFLAEELANFWSTPGRVPP